jgi:hypothetical protein
MRAATRLQALGRGRVARRRRRREEGAAVVVCRSMRRLTAAKLSALWRGRRWGCTRSLNGTRVEISTRLRLCRRGGASDGGGAKPASAGGAGPAAAAAGGQWAALLSACFGSGRGVGYGSGRLHPQVAQRLALEMVATPLDAAVVEATLLLKPPAMDELLQLHSAQQPVKADAAAAGGGDVSGISGQRCGGGSGDAIHRGAQAFEHCLEERVWSALQLFRSKSSGITVLSAARHRSALQMAKAREKSEAAERECAKEEAGGGGDVLVSDEES